ncbi:angiogenic factor with G patch and FHA domains 1 isoform X2 [Brachionus plicatilis]|uniref:Angiogenic factor with G patch and FHA domains 1 isoform X2 n=1 Tax=Brachionus plicatilis TaxID=10195 RepID=A0A3M7T634_BRAPC|nr:angiogenic factor with G patch and FHA domains 1 isoform X2 [Brachionus plicatilis]
MNKNNNYCQTDEELVYNFAWSKYYQHFVNYHLSQNQPSYQASNDESNMEVLDAESIKKIAESTMENRGFLYDDRSGLYFDAQNALYYDQSQQLYYDIEGGISYKFKLISQTNSHHLRFHSKIPKNELYRLRKLIGLGELDKEELSDAMQSSESEPETHDASKYPPCIRAILIDSGKTNFDPGSLFLVPYTGGLIGSGDEPSKYVLHFPDEDKIDKIHASIRFDKRKKKFLIKDENSSNGTWLNEKKLETQIETELRHGDKLLLGKSVALLVHIHEGSNTCINCEPGEVMHKLQLKKESIIENEKKFSYDRENIRRENVKLIKSKYGLNYGQDKKSTISDDYIDRAKQRRDEFGVDYSHIEKIDVTLKQTDEKVKSEIGLKLMSKMGWKEGKGLGKEETGITEPISTKIKLDKSGIGSATSSQIDLESDDKMRKKYLKWKKTKERFESITPAAINSKISNIFNVDDENDEN